MATFLKNKLKAIDLDELFKTIQESRTLLHNGKTSYQGYEFFEAEAILCSALDINPQIQGDSREGIKIKGIREACRKADFDKESILAAVKQEEVQYLQKPRQRYVILGNISVDPRLRIAPRRFRNESIQVSFSRHRPKDFAHHRQEKLFFQQFSAASSYFRISVCSRTPEEAVTRGLAQIDLLRAFWNMTLTGNQRTFFSSQRQSLNQIVIGPFYSIHFPRGALVSDSKYWFEPGYCYANTSFHDSGRIWPEVERAERWFRRRLGRLPHDRYRDLMVSALRRYTRALDSIVWDDVALRLWSVLELLTGRTPQDNFEVVVKRASGLFLDCKRHRQVLEYLRQQRNQSVHDDNADPRDQDRLYLLKHYVERLMNFHLVSARRFGGFQAACEYLELPNETATLRSEVVSLRQQIQRRELLIGTLEKVAVTSAKASKGSPILRRTQPC